MELHRGGAENTWELFDLDFNLKPVNKSSGEPINALHMLNLVRAGLASSQVELRKIANDAIYDVSGFAFDGTQYRRNKVMNLYGVSGLGVERKRYIKLVASFRNCREWKCLH